ncbi:hypothetical protein SACS_0905 [Parasaccharibacter apium]|uniref:Uncharacterized protein n=1 Tax=Parasaccharibacter apium TaxID=1510841 RepID=A0A7U7G5S2_9PROT|nr:hypothetical protein SACS_0905 [Parasaccharibacter apium]
MLRKDVTAEDWALCNGMFTFAFFRLCGFSGSEYGLSVIHMGGKGKCLSAGWY